MFACGYCNKVFNSENGRENHTADVHGASAVLQNQGIVPVKSYDMLKQPNIKKANPSKVQVSTEKTYQCKFRNCFKEFSSKTARGNHFQKVHSDAPSSFSCTFCSQIFKSLNKLENHKKELHRDQNQSQSVSGISLMCVDCSKCFTSNKELDQHKLTKHSSGQIHTALQLVHKDVISAENLFCGYCLLHFNSANDLKQHKITRHNAFPPLVTASPSNTTQKANHSVPKTFLDSIDCKNCSQKFETLLQLLQHRENRHNNKFICDLCLQLYNTAKDLQQHRTSKHAAPNMLLSSSFNLLVCPYCSQGFPSSAQLYQHKEAKHKEIIACGFCNQRLNSAVDLEQHRAVKHVPNNVQAPVLSCKDCPQQFPTWTQLLQHREAKHKVVFSCEVCVQQFNSAIDLEQHKTAKHEVFKTVQASSFICKDCSQQFQTSAQLLQHKDAKHKKIFLCPFCNQEFKAVIDLEQHKTAKHGAPKPVVAPKVVQTPKLNLIACTYCSQKFETSSQLLQHTEAKHKGIIACGDCSQHFNTAIDLEQHKKAKHGVFKTVQTSSFICKDCSQQFQTSAQLLQHKDAKHKKIFLCPFCNQEFKAVIDLERHTTTKHAAPKAVQTPKFILITCTYCSQKFETSSQLQQHIERKHKDIIACGICAQQFNSAIELEQHRTDKHGSVKTAETYCTYCSQEFQTAGHLLQHTEAKHNNFACGFCLQRFNTSKDLERHKRFNHRSPNQVPSGLINSICCIDCSQHFGTLQQLLQHKIMKHMKFVCNSCLRCFDDMKDLEQHKVIEHGLIDTSSRVNEVVKNVISCIYCSMSFQKLEHLELHKDSVHKNKDYFPCSYCSQPFTTDRDKIMHMEKLHHLIIEQNSNVEQVPMHACAYCVEMFKTKLDLFNHVKTSHELINCRFCNKLFTDPKTLTQHIQGAHMSNNDNFVCKYCFINIFTSQISLKQHLKNVHHVKLNLDELLSNDDSSNDIETIPSVNKPVICHYCTEEFASGAKLQQHFEDVHKYIDYFPCQNCEKVFFNETDRNTHIYASHVSMCGYCYKQFGHADFLKKHKETVHRDVDYFPCHSCDDIFTSNISRKKHIDQQHIEVCRYCFKRFVDLHLKQHEEDKHKNVDFFPCDFCNQVFLTEISRNDHNDEVHNVKCNYCTKTFTNIERLKQHEVDAHTNVDRLPCNTCNEVFPSMLALTHHLEDVHQVKCGYCLATFKDIDGLKQHLDVKHKNIDFFPCDACNQIFSCEMLRKTHTDFFHRVKCDYCSNTFNSIKSLKQHESDKHINVDIFPCEACHDIFLSPILRKNHSNDIHKVKCGCCLEIFDTIEHLKQHEADNHKIIESSSVQCSYCTKKFDEVDLLRNHEEVKHKNVDYFPCDYCLETFSSNISRRKHHSTKHVPNKSKSSSPINDSFACLYCLEHYFTNEDLEKHIKELHKREEESRRDGIYSKELQQQLDLTSKFLRDINKDK